MKGELHFDNNFETYNDVRPGYPNEIYELISKYKSFDKKSKILEIGAGNGVASKDVYEKWLSKLTLIEPGDNFCKLLQNRFNNIEDIKIKNTTFEKYSDKTLFDAVISATAFHWVDLSVKYKKSYEILENDGLLILFWNYYGIEDVKMENLIQNIYIKYGMGKNDNKNGYERQIEIINDRKHEIEDSNYFKIIDSMIVKRTFEYSTNKNTQLLKTFPNHSQLDENFFKEIESIIEENDGKINLRVLTNIEICEKSGHSI